MPNLNTCIFMGHLTDNPTIRRTSTGSAVCDFYIAVHRRSKQQDDDVLFLGCVAWGKLAEGIVQYMRKGGCILVEGYLKQEKWETREGEKQSRMRLVCESAQFINGAGSPREEQPQEPPPPNSPEPPPDAAGNDIQF